jgi:Tol biopolymer transport system component
MAESFPALKKLFSFHRRTGEYTGIAISPDGMRVAVSRVDPQTGEDIWLYQLARGVNARFTFQGGRFTVWSPDGSRIVFESTRDGRASLYEKLSNGSGGDELLFKSEDNNFPLGWSPDGRFLFFASDGVPLRSWVLPLDSQGHAAGKPYLFFSGGAAEGFSPDMRWVTYVSDESGRFKIYVRPFDPDSANGSPPCAWKWQVSAVGGLDPHWNANGKELIYLALDGAFVGVDVIAKPVFQAGPLRVLFKSKGWAPNIMGWDMRPSRKKFLVSHSHACSCGRAVHGGAELDVAAEEMKLVRERFQTALAGASP